MASVERLACCGSVAEIVVHGDQPLDVGREQRLYTPRQRIALAARDGKNDYWLIPPVDINPLQKPRPLRSKSLAFEELQRAALGT